LIHLSWRPDVPAWRLPRRIISRLCFVLCRESPSIRKFNFCITFFLCRPKICQVPGVEGGGCFVVKESRSRIITKSTRPQRQSSVGVTTPLVPYNYTCVCGSASSNRVFIVEAPRVIRETEYRQNIDLPALLRSHLHRSRGRH
jgi:hypothetical protein